MKNPRRNMPFIIIEKGKQKYTISKMQSAGIVMAVLDNDGALEEQIKALSPIKNRRADVTFYLIGSDEFVNRSRELILASDFKGTISREYSDEDTCMKALNCEFPKLAPVKMKESPSRKSLLQEECLKMEIDPLSDSDMVAVLIAADELQHYQISPPTPENIRKALISRTKLYLQDTGHAEALVDRYLSLAEKVLSTHCG